MALILVRIGYGGDIGGILYVLQVEDPFLIAAGVALLVAAVILSLAELVAPRRPPRIVTLAAAAIAFGYALFLVQDAHRSGTAILAASVAIAVLAIVPSGDADPSRRSPG